VPKLKSALTLQKRKRLRENASSSSAAAASLRCGGRSTAYCTRTILKQFYYDLEHGTFIPLPRLLGGGNGGGCTRAFVHCKFLHAARRAHITIGGVRGARAASQHTHTHTPLGCLGSPAGRVLSECLRRSVLRALSLSFSLGVWCTRESTTVCSPHPRANCSRSHRAASWTWAHTEVNTWCPRDAAGGIGLLPRRPSNHIIYNFQTFLLQKLCLVYVGLTIRMKCDAI
jgi:hypothetical protein